MTTLKINDPAVEKIVATYGEEKILEMIKQFAEQSDKSLETEINKAQTTHQNEAQQFRSMIDRIKEQIPHGYDASRAKEEYHQSKY